MECNKEEAARAKALAERKMEDKDFVGAKKMIIKAQQLSKEVDNVSQRMLAVCDVHCAAGVKVNGQIDWYGILQVPANADDTLIKKQYKRLALLLHPDKNTLAGAEAAFKLLGEANMTLTDRSKRSVYDMKRNTIVRGSMARPQYQQPRRPAPTSASGTPVNLHSMHHQQQHQASNSAGQQSTFWTMCPSCGMRYQYYHSILKKPLRCQRCLKPFIAHELKEEAVPSVANQRSAGVWKNAGAPQSASDSQANVTGQKAGNSASPGVHVNASHHVNVNRKREANGKAVGQDKMKPPRATGNPVKASTVGQKRGRRAVVESSISSDSETTSDSEDDVVEQGPAANSAGPREQTRRSTRQRQEVKYNEESDEDDIEADSNEEEHDDDETIASPPSWKRLRKTGQFHGDHRNETTKMNEDIAGHNGPTNGVNACSNAEDKKKCGAPRGEKTFSRTEQMEQETMQAGEKSDGKEKAFHSVSNNGLEPNYGDPSDDDKVVFLDPEFFDFDQLRNERQFKPNQIWAVYDDDGCMPRFYARITKVKTTPNFMVHYVWLEFDPKNQMEAAWHNRGLPVACGRFKHGKSETTKETGMFSRTISFEKSKTRNSYEIYPRKGEVWALFKEWNISWTSDAKNDRRYQYEVVQVLSDCTTSTSIIVMPLVRIEGYVSLFIQSKEAAPYVIPQGETLRFSHCIPHHLLCGTEREGILEGSMELDPAGLPNKFEESFPSVTLDCSSAKNQGCDARHAGSSHGNSPQKGPPNAETTAKIPKEETSKHKTHAADFTDEDEDNICQTEYVYDESEFHDFSELRLLQNFSVGQVWALYSDIDKFPNYYGLIHKVDLKNGKVQVRWLDACPQGEEEKRLLQEGRPIACGSFEVSNIHDMMTYRSTDAFSHPVGARSTCKKGKYEIVPGLGEIWAVYKNWRTGWTTQDYEKCEYELVEIFGHTDSSTQVKLLRKVDGYNMVFMTYHGEGSVKTIRKDEYLKFSHQVPCFHLTYEKGGKLRGCLELDFMSLPEEFLSTKSR